jgi:hypothetical protein
MVRVLLTLGLLFTVFTLNAQIKDTVKYAREQAEQKNLKEAERLLSIYTKNSNDVYGHWLYAQVLYWQGKTDQSLELFENIYIKHPELVSFKLDYGRVLFECGKLTRAKTLLKEYLQTNPSHAESLIMLAYIDFWNGKIKQSKKQAEQVLNNNPGNEMAKKLLNEIMVLTAPYINAGSTLFSDDQPLKNKTYGVEVGKHHSWLISPILSAGISDFSITDQTLRSTFIQASNKFTFGSNGPTITISGGAFKPKADEPQTEFIGNIYLSQKLSNHLFLDLNKGIRPYQFTLISIEQPIMQSVSSIALRFQNQEKLNGKLAYEQQAFFDQNIIHTTYAYLLKPIIKQPAFRFDLGYSFSYANSVRNTFRTVEPITSATKINTPLNGIYDPYFSPSNQMVNALLLSFKLIPSKKVEFRFRSSYGFFARADNPEISVRRIGREFLAQKSYGTLNYTPLDFFGEVKTHVSKKFTVSAHYQFSRLFFYEFHQVGLSVSYKFLKKEL